MDAPEFSLVPQPLDRVDGRLKVTGQARYAAEFKPEGLAYGVLVQSIIAKGKITQILAAEAESAPGVLGVLTHRNMPRLGPPPEDLLGKGQPGESAPPLQNDRILHSGQHIAVVVGQTLEAAQYGASLLRVEYAEEPPLVQMEPVVGELLEPELWAGREKLQVSRGNADGAFAAAESKVNVTYRTPVQNHNPIELFSSTAVWEAPDKLLLYETTRWVKGVQRIAASAFGLAVDDVRVMCPFLGGHFGSKGFQWQHFQLAAAAARMVGRPVRIEFSRRQMFTTAGRRSVTVQALGIGATHQGLLTAVRHSTLASTSFLADYTEPCGNMSRNLYTCPNVTVSHHLTRLNLPTPCPMRAPGETPGVFALECAIDELAHELKMDPLEVRRRNHADKDEHERKPYSNKHLLECYRLGAERFGWAERNPAPGMTRAADGRRLLGWGMATAVYPAKQMPAAAKASLWEDGRVVVRSATHEAGTGTYTGMTQIVAAALGVAPETIRFELGDTKFPLAPVNGGSWLTSSVGPAVLAACEALKKRLIGLASADPASPLAGVKPEEIAAQNGRLFVKSQPARGVAYADLLKQARLPVVEAEAEAKPSEEDEKYAHLSFGAHFAEVAVDPDLGEVRLQRWVGVYDVGRIINPKVARSQFLGGITFGLSAALHEHSAPDPRTGRTVNADLAEYHIPVNADVPPDMDISFLGEADPNFISPLGLRGLGELGIVGAPAAVANAIFHATGRRIRELPITPDKLML